MNKITDKDQRRELVDGLMKGIESEFSGVDIWLSYNKFTDSVVLSKIVINKKLRGKGIGSAVMKRITDFADSNGMKVVLTPSSDFGGSVGRLKGFYKGFGFRDYRGYEHRETMEREPVMKLYEILFEEILYHVTSKRRLRSILRNGLKVQAPKDMEDVAGVYLFGSKDDAEEAVMNWLGDRFDEDEELVLIKVDGDKVVDRSSSAAGYEVISTKDIPKEGIIGYETI
jgi:GNAT superfamily N-acetyltransferase